MKKLVKRVSGVLILLVSLWIAGHLIALKMYDYRCERVMHLYPKTKPFLTWWCGI